MAEKTDKKKKSFLLHPISVKSFKNIFFFGACVIWLVYPEKSDYLGLNLLSLLSYYVSAKV